MADTYTLYGSYASYFTAKVRAYLRKKGIPFVERVPGVPRFREVVRKQSDNHRIPQLETPDGTVLQDTIAIFDALEPLFPEPPATVPEDAPDADSGIGGGENENGGGGTAGGGGLASSPAMPYTGNMEEFHRHAQQTPSNVAKRTKQEIRSAQKMARRHQNQPYLWSKCLINTCYSLWFIHLPGYMLANDGKPQALRIGLTLLQRMKRLRLHPADEICYRVMMQLCGGYNQPVLAVKVKNCQFLCYVRKP